MKKNILLFLIFFLSVYNFYGQPSIQFQKSLGGIFSESGNWISNTSDGGFIGVGHTQSNDGDVIGNHGGIFDSWVVKLDSTGTIQWQKCLGGSGDEEALSVQQTVDGGYIVAGYSNSNDGDVIGHHGIVMNYDAWVVKLNSAGNIQWQKCLGGSGEDVFSSVQQTSDSGYIFSGHSESNDGDVIGHHGTATNFDAWVVKLNSTGAILWQKTLGGSLNDGAISMSSTFDGGYIIGGATASNDGDVSGNHLVGSYNCWIVKLDNLRNIQWQKSFGGTDDDGGGLIQQTSDTGFIFVGTTASNDSDVSGNHGGFFDSWVVKLDSAGTIQWQKCLGGTGDDGSSSIQQTVDGGYILAGHSDSDDGDVIGHHGTFTNYDAWVVKLDSAGDIQWQKCLGGTGDDGSNSVQRTTDGGIILLGFSDSMDGDLMGVGHGGGDFWIIKLSSVNNVFDIQNHITNFFISPNPFSNETIISFNISNSAVVKMEIYNTKAHLIKSLSQDFFTIGENEILWDGTDNKGRKISNGLYHLNIISNGVLLSKKVVLIRN